MSIRKTWVAGLLVILALTGIASVAAAQAIIGTVDGSNQAIVFPSPGVGLPTPVQNVVPGANGHGVSYYGTDNALVSNFSGSTIYVIKISTATIVDTINTTGFCNTTGTVAVAPGLNFALCSGGANSVAVIAAPFGASSTITTVALPGAIAGYQTEAIVFNAAGRAFIYHVGGISVLDPPYSSVAFTIPIANSLSGAIAISPDGNNLLTTDISSGNVHIFSAPYSAASTFVDLAIPGGSGLDGIMATPDGTKTLVVDAFSGGQFWAISPPYSASSTVETIALAGFTSGYEDVGISADSQLAIFAGDGSGDPNTPFVQAPFTTVGATVFNVQIPGGRGNGGVRFLPPGLAPGLTISKSGPPTIQTGQNLTYTITYGNTGGATANGVVISDPVPAGTTFVSATGGGTFSAGVVTWNIGTVAAGSTGLTVSFTVNVTATTGSVDNVNYTIAGTGIAPVPGPPVFTQIGAGGPTPTPTPPSTAVVPTLSTPMTALLAIALVLIAFLVLSRNA